MCLGMRNAAAGPGKHEARDHPCYGWAEWARGCWASHTLGIGQTLVEARAAPGRTQDVHRVSITRASHLLATRSQLRSVRLACRDALQTRLTRTRRHRNWAPGGALLGRQFTMVVTVPGVDGLGGLRTDATSETLLEGRGREERITTHDAHLAGVARSLALTRDCDHQAPAPAARLS